MISIVICSRSKEVDQYLLNNINDTIGVPYELQYIDNSENEYDIFTAYNKGAMLSNHDIICFMHDDIIFKTKNWGNLVLEKFNNTQLGAIGIAGTPYASLLPGTWWCSNKIAQNIIQLGKIDCVYYSTGSNDEQISPVILLDGVWMCIRKSLFQFIRFDEYSFKGFHMYDMDISMQIFKNGFKLASVYDILIEHKSLGKLDSNWLENRIKFYNKWRKTLPLSIIDISFFDKLTIEFRNLVAYLKIRLKQ